MNQAKPSLIDTSSGSLSFPAIAWCIGIILPFLEPRARGAVIAIALYLSLPWQNAGWGTGIWWQGSC